MQHINGTTPTRLHRHSVQYSELSEENYDKLVKELKTSKDPAGFLRQLRLNPFSKPYYVVRAVCLRRNLDAGACDLNVQVDAYQPPWLRCVVVQR